MGQLCSSALWSDIVFLEAPTGFKFPASIQMNPRVKNPLRLEKALQLIWTSCFAFPIENSQILDFGPPYSCKSDKVPVINKAVYSNYLSDWIPRNSPPALSTAFQLSVKNNSQKIPRLGAATIYRPQTNIFLHPL